MISISLLEIKSNNICIVAKILKDFMAEMKELKVQMAFHEIETFHP